MNEREFDVILYGASGFTGRQAARYFAEFAPAGVRWAIARRNRAKLEALDAGVPILVADSTDPREAAALGARTRVLLTTAGPYELYGDQLVAACVAEATHYVDITGSVVWVRSLIDRYHEQAERAGTRIIPCCGFDSVPADLGVYLLLKLLGPGLCEAKGYFQVKGGRPNGGTIASAQQTYSSGADKVGRDLFVLSPGWQRAPWPLEADPRKATFDPDAGGWVAPFPMSPIDTRVVRRSCLLAGVDVAFQEYLLCTGRFAGLKASLVSVAIRGYHAILRSRALRDVATKLIKAGEGPSDTTMDNGFFRARFLGKATDGRTAEVSLFSKGDPANRVTVKCACESALALVCDAEHLPQRAGVLTPSTGLGDALLNRLQTRGVHITTRVGLL